MTVAGAGTAFAGLEIGARLMSVMGQERTLAALNFMSALPPITDIRYQELRILSNGIAQDDDNHRKYLYLTFSSASIGPSMRSWDLWPRRR